MEEDALVPITSAAAAITAVDSDAALDSADRSYAQWYQWCQETYFASYKEWPSHETVLEWIAYYSSSDSSADVVSVAATSDAQASTVVSAVDHTPTQSLTDTVGSDAQLAHDGASTSSQHRRRQRGTAATHRTTVGWKSQHARYFPSSHRDYPWYSRAYPRTEASFLTEMRTWTEGRDQNLPTAQQLDLFHMCMARHKAVHEASKAPLAEVGHNAPTDEPATAPSCDDVSDEIMQADLVHRALRGLAPVSNTRVVFSDDDDDDTHVPAKAPALLRPGPGPPVASDSSPDLTDETVQAEMVHRALRGLVSASNTRVVFDDDDDEDMVGAVPTLMPLSANGNTSAARVAQPGSPLFEGSEISDDGEEEMLHPSILDVNMEDEDEHDESAVQRLLAEVEAQRQLLISRFGAAQTLAAPRARPSIPAPSAVIAVRQQQHGDEDDDPPEEVSSKDPPQVLWCMRVCVCGNLSPHVHACA